MKSRTGIVRQDPSTTRRHISQRDSYARAQIQALAHGALGLIDKLIADRPPQKRPMRAGHKGHAVLPPRAKQYFRKTDPELLRMLNRAARGEPSTEATAFVESYRALGAKLTPHGAQPNRKLAMLVSVNLLETVQYAGQLSKNLRRIRQVTGPGRPRQARIVLASIYQVELAALRRAVNKLRRDIPNLVEALGGDPSEELLVPRKRPRK